MTADLNDSERRLVESVAVLADDVILPAAAQGAESGEFPQQIVDEMARLGLFGTLIPREYGGLGIGLVAHVAVTEELARAWLSVAGVLNPHVVCATALVESGTESQKRDLLPRMARGELRGAVSLTEPHAGSDVQAITTTATRLPDRSFRLSGHKRWITNGLGAGLVLVLAKTDPEAIPAHRGMSCFLVEKEPWAADNAGAWAGASVTEVIDKMGDQGVDTTDLVLDGYLCPANRVLGEEKGLGRGFSQVMRALETGRIGASSMCVGLAQRCLDLSVFRAMTRHTFGRRIADHQAVSSHLAEMATKVHAARLVTGHAASLKQAGRPAGSEAGMAKLLAAESAKEVAELAFRIHGSDGYARGTEVERLLRDGLSLIAAEGPSEIQRIVVARGLIRRAEAVLPPPP